MWHVTFLCEQYFLKLQNINTNGIEVKKIQNYNFYLDFSCISEFT